ncbi:hypothetical protein P5673_032876, partial [Acropora cervicornis]
VCRQCRGDHHRTVGSIEMASDVQDPRPSPTSHPEPLIHEPSCSAEFAEEIVELPQLPPATEESEQLSADPVLHVRFQEDLISKHSNCNSDPSDRLSDTLSRQNGSSPLRYSTAFTTSIISSEWLLKEGSARRGHSANLTMSSRTQRYYRKKAEQAIEGVLKSIAPGNVSWLYQQVIQRRTRLQTAEGIVEDTLVCGASLKKSLAGLDSTQTDGVQALATLENIANELKQAGLDSTIADNILTRLKAGRQYLKMDFKIHTASESPCAEHCRLFALSRTVTEYKGQCQHQHSISCDRCEDLKNAVSDLQLAVDSREVHLR